MITLEPENRGSCLGNCLTGDDKITTIRMKAKQGTIFFSSILVFPTLISTTLLFQDPYNGRKTSGIVCTTSSCFSKSTLVFSCALLCVASTSTSTIPNRWAVMSQFLSYNLQDSSKILDQTTNELDQMIVCAGAITFLSLLSYFSSVRSVGPRCQYFIDVVCYTVACGISISIFLKLLVNVPLYNSFCHNEVSFTYIHARCF